MQKENKVKEYLRTSPRFQDALPEEQMKLSYSYEMHTDAGLILKIRTEK
jgi:hypothetical protein